MHDLADQLLFHLKAIWHYRWYAIGCAWLIAAGGWSSVYLTPDRYEANARVYVDTQSMLRPLLTGLAVQPNVDQMVAMMSRTLISRVNVEKVIRMADMDIGLSTSESREGLIAYVTRQLTIQSAGRENLYTISYVDQNPERAKRVVESLLAIFMEGSLGDKRKDSESARRFIDEQLKGYNEKLIAAEKAVTEFKRRHQGLAPGAGGDYYARLNDARTARRQAVLELREAENSRDAIKKQLAGEEAITIRRGGGGTIVAGLSDLDTRIRALEEKLDSLRLTYTERHPDIVALQRIIAQLKEQKQAEEKIEKPATRVPRGRVYEDLAVALASAEANVAVKRTRVEEYDIRYKELQATANSLPQIEAEYAQLTRDYDVIKNRYASLLERRESAQISGDVEVSDVVMGFRVIDPPQVPPVPSAPNRPRLVSLVLLMALAGGLGFAFLIGQLRPTFSDERRLKEVSGFPVLGTVAMAWTDEQKKRRTRGLVAFVLSLLSLLSAYVAVIASLVLTVSRA
jgi:polysaccharide chain length determinant protein (PEP-CTERM system associated)